MFLFLTSAHAADPPPTRLQEVKVTAGADALAEQREAVSQKTVIDKKEIEALGGLTVGEVIRKLPGIDAGEHGADGGMDARARGMSRGAVQFLVNGERPTANARFALTQIGRMPAGELERIEILRGGSAEFGGAAAVTVNLVMRRPVAQAATSLKLTAGQRGPEANAQASVSRGGGEGGFTWLLPISVNRHGMPVDLDLARSLPPAWTQRETERGDYTLDEFVLSPRLAWKRGADSLTLWPSHYHNDGERTTVLRRETGSTRVDQEDNGIRITRLRAEGETRLDEAKLSGRAALMTGRRFADRRRTDSLGAAWTEAERRKEREYSAALRLDRPFGDLHLLSLGVEYAQHRREERLTDTGHPAASTDFDGEARQGTLWLQDEWTLRPDLTATLGLRAEAMRIALEGARRRHAAIDPALALRWEASPGWVTRVSASGAIRFPRLEELTAVVSRSASVNTPLEPDRGGNPGLEPERIANLEAGLERHLPGGVLGANLYLRRTGDFIERRTVLEGGRWVERPVNVGEARHWGLELSAKLNQAAFLPKGGSLRAQLTLPRGEVTDARLGIERRPRELPRYNLTLGFEHGLPTWHWGFQWQLNGPVETDIPGETVATTRRRSLLDTHLVRRLDRALNLRLTLQNLLGADLRRDAAAWQGGNAWQLDRREAGQRTWLLSLEGKW